MLINLRVRTEFSFKQAYGPLAKVFDAVGKVPALGITDRGGTWGHVQFAKEAKKRGVKPILGVELGVVADATKKEKQPANFVAFLARNPEGLREIYRLTSLATEQFYYIPRLDYGTLHEVSDNVFILSGSTPMFGSLPRRPNLFVDLGPTSQRRALDIARQRGLRVVATSDNHFPRVTDKNKYEVISGRERQSRTTPMHLLTADEWGLLWDCPEALEATLEIADACSVEFVTAQIPHLSWPKTLEEMCRAAAPHLGVDLKRPEYAERLERELRLIHEKEFQDYFYIVTDAVTWAKARMFVGPARGSSCGSLACYLLGITDIDPIPFNLLFERFIDINRKDYPDIDIDFPIDRREEVFNYLAQKYGAENVARIGTVNRFQSDSTIGEVAKELGIPAWETTNIKGAIIERAAGDERAHMCIRDTFDTLDVGREFLKKFPQMEVAADVEGHAKHTGKHPAGVAVTSEPVKNYCTVDAYLGVTHVDKVDAEILNLLKIDVLGLRNLSIIDDCLNSIGKPREWLVRYPFEDRAAFDVFNRGKWSGIFQFEGEALKGYARQIKVQSFMDIVNLTSIARPGPMMSGASSEWISRRIGKTPVKYLHPLVKRATEDSLGVIIYQEQVMMMAKEMGQMTWEDVSSIRKLMAKSKGAEAINKFKPKFLEGAARQGVKLADAEHVWESIASSGAYLFNKSHAVAYGRLSYWTAVLKAHFPLEFFAASLRDPKSEDQTIQLLRELSKEGIKFKAFDPERSEKNWTVKGGELIGGLTNIKGVGEAKAEEILKRRKAGLPLTPAQDKLVREGKTPFDAIFECRERFGHIMADPKAYNIVTPITPIEQITGERAGVYLFFGRIKEKILRDHNEPASVSRRGGREMKGKTTFLDLVVEDDTGFIKVTIDRFKFEKQGKPLVENAKVGDWFLWRGSVQKGWARVQVDRYRNLEEVKKGEDK